MSLSAQKTVQDDGVAPWAEGVAPQGRDGRHPVLSLDIGDHSLSIRARAFVFSDPRSRALIPLIERIAPSDANVLVTGETGTGKELVARYVHSLSARASKPFVAINCGAFSETLIEGELFGFEKGAFTGAVTSKAGWFEAANGGTLFLDEIGDLPLALQVKLLRVLQEREVVRLGSRTPLPLNIRLIAATNVDLGKSVDAGHFREDLFYRLQVVPLPLLPLRDRRADILPLARHFLQIYGDRLRAERLDISAAAEEALYNYAWPGNIRELENTVHRAVLTCNGGIIEVADLALPIGMIEPDRGSGSTNAALEDAIQSVVRRRLDNNEPDVLDRVIAATVREAYHRCDGNQIRAAAALGVTRNVIRTYLKNFGLI